MPIPNPTHLTDYNKKTWEIGNLITHDQMNNIENGLDILNQEIRAAYRNDSTDTLKQRFEDIESNFAGAFSPSTPYTAGKYVTYTDGKFYRFTADHAAGAWNSAHAVAVTVGGELVGKEAEISELKSALTADYDGQRFIDGSLSYGVFENNMPVADPRTFNAVMMTAEKYGYDITIKAKTGYNFLAYWYDNNDTFVGKSENWETERKISANTNFRLWVRPNPLDTSIVLDLAVVKTKIVFDTYLANRGSENSDNIDYLQTEIDEANVGRALFVTTFAHGKIDSSNMPEVDQSYLYQAITPELIHIGKDITIKCNSGYEFMAYWYTSEGTYVSRLAGWTQECDMPSDRYFRLFIRTRPVNIHANVDIAVFATNIYYISGVGELFYSPLSKLPTYIVNSLSYMPTGALSKGYILLSCDDGTAGLATYTIPMLAQKEVPCTFGLFPTSEVVTNATYLETLLGAINDGCCVAMHGYGNAQWPSQTEYALNKYFDSAISTFTTAGIDEVYGAICPGGSGADTNKLVQAIAGGRFGAVFSGGMQGEIKYGSYNAVGARTNMYAMTRYSAIGFTQSTYQAAIDDAYTNHYILCPFWHDYEIVSNAAYKAIIEGMIDYAKTKGLTFITMKDLPNIT